MKAEIRELLADFKAAARLGHPEGLQVALDGLRDLPEAAANARLSEAFIQQALLPLGRALAHPQLDLLYLRPLLEDPLAAVRAVAAVALAARFFAGAQVSEQDLRRAGRDHRPEVRAALGQALGQAGADQAEALLELLSPWLALPAGPRLRQAALLALPYLVPVKGPDLLPLVQPLADEADPQAQAALVTALVALAAGNQPGPVLDLLARWAAAVAPNEWVITRTLSASWAAGHRLQAEAILKVLETRTGPTRHIASARQALARHTD